jgi:hypothetical protein
MKSKDFSALGKKLLPYLSGYRVKGALIFAEPIGHILRGIAFDSSSHSSTSFYIHVFFQPLCVPSSHMHLTLGDRLRDMNNIDGWDSERPNLVADIGESIIAKALPLLDRVRTLEGAAEAAQEIGAGNSHVQEAAAFCRALAGDTQTALSALEKIPDGLDRSVAWQAEQAERIEQFRTLLRGDPIAARKQLLVWEAETAQKIGLGSFWKRTE